MIFLVIFPLFFAGCATSHPPPSRTLPQTSEGTLNLFVQLLKNHLHTSGTFAADYAHSVKYVSQTIGPISSDQLNELLESTFRRTRTFWESLNERMRFSDREFYPISTELTKTFLVFRFINIATESEEVTDLKDISLNQQSKNSPYLELANAIIHETSYDDLMKNFRQNAILRVVPDTYSILVEICLGLNVHPDCPSISLQAYLGIFSAIILSKNVHAKFLENSLKFIADVYTQFRSEPCKPEHIQNAFQKKVSQTFSTFVLILDIPPRSTDPLAQQLKSVNEKLKILDTMNIPYC